MENTGRVAELSPLTKDESGVWRMDYMDMDRRIKENHIHLVILCSPHNPCGRVWTREEREQAMTIFRENRVNPKFCVNSKSRCKTEQKYYSGAKAPCQHYKRKTECMSRAAARAAVHFTLDVQAVFCYLGYSGNLSSKKIVS